MNYDMGQMIFSLHVYPIAIKHALAILINISLIVIKLGSLILDKIMGFSSLEFIIIIFGVACLDKMMGCSSLEFIIIIIVGVACLDKMMGCSSLEFSIIIVGVAFTLGIIFTVNDWEIFTVMANNPEMMVFPIMFDNYYILNKARVFFVDK